MVFLVPNPFLPVSGTGSVLFLPGSVSKFGLDPNPYQHNTDLQHWWRMWGFKRCLALFYDERLPARRKPLLKRRHPNEWQRPPPPTPWPSPMPAVWQLSSVHSVASLASWPGQAGESRLQPFRCLNHMLHARKKIVSNFSCRWAKAISYEKSNMFKSVSWAQLA